MQICIFISILITGIAMSPIKTGVSVEFDLASTQVYTQDFSIHGPAIGFYVRPSLVEQELRSTLKHKHLQEEETKKSPKSKKKSTKDNRMLSSVSSPGVLDFNFNEQDSSVDSFYHTAVFRNVATGTYNLKVTCKQGPCQGTFEGQTLQDDEPTDTNEFSLSPGHPLKAFNIELPASSTKWQRLILTLKSEEEVLEESNVALEVVGEPSLVAHRVANRLVLVVQRDSTTAKAIYIVLSASNPHSTKSTMVVTQKVFMADQRIERDVEVIDYVNDKNTYKINLSSKFESFGISMNSLIAGQTLPHLYGNVDNRPDNAQDYKIKYEGSDYVTVLFRSQEIEGDTLYLLLTSSEGEVVKLQYSKTNDDPTLIVDQQYYSQIIPNGLHSYLVKAYPAGEQNGMYLQVDIKEIDSKLDENNLQIYAKACVKPNCEDERFNDNKLQVIPSQSLQINNGKVEIRPSCDITQQDSDGYCWFTIAVKANKNKELRYVIHSSHATGSIVLKTNEPFSSEILEGDYHQLMFYYEHQVDDTSLTFSVSNSNVAFLISNNNKCNPVRPNCAKYYGSVENPITLRGDSLIPGAFYIAVQGLSLTSYCITAEVRKSSSVTIIELKEGQSYRGNLHPGMLGEVINYFRFSTDFKDEQEDTLPTIELNLSGSHYKLILLLSVDGTLPSDKGFDSISTEGFIAIQPKDQLYSAKKVYYAAVQFIFYESIEVIDNSTTLPYTITYATSKTLRHFPLNHIISDSLQSGQFRTFYFLYDVNHKPLYISKSHMEPISKDLEFYLTSEIDEKLIDITHMIKVLPQEIGSSTQLVTEEELQKLCGPQQESDNNDTVCQIFLQVENVGKTPILYSMTLWNPGETIELVEGIPQQYNLEHISTNQSISFLYNPASYTHDLQILIQSYYGDVSYNVSVLDSVSLAVQFEDYQSVAHNSHSKTISPKVFETCKPNCQVIVDVKAEMQSNNQLGWVDGYVTYDDIFSIVVSQKFLQIIVDQMIEFSVSHMQPRYFVLTNIKFTDTLVVSLQELVGRASICVSLSDDENLRMPLYDAMNCDFHVVGGRVELSPTNITNLMTKLNMTLVNNPALIIEVSSLNNQNNESLAKVELIVEWANSASKQVLLANPMRVQLGEDSNTQLIYFHYVPEDIEVKITRISGYGYLTIDLKDQDGKIVSYLPETFLAGQSQTSIKISTTDPKYCTLCTYCFTLRTAKDISLLAIVTVTCPTQFVKLSQGVTYMDSLDTNNTFNIYRVPVDVSKQIEVTLHLYNGDPSLRMGFTASLEPTSYELGPYDVKKVAQDLQLEQAPGFFEVVVPPRQELLNDPQYNISLDVTKFQGHFIDDDFYLIVTSQDQVINNYSLMVTQATNGVASTLQDGVITQAIFNRMKSNATFLYYHLSDASPLLIMRQVGGAPVDFNRQFLVQAKLAPGTEHTGTNHENFAEVNLILYSIHEGQATYRFPPQTGLYEITITSKVSPAQPSVINRPIIFSRWGPQPSMVKNTQPYQYDLNYIDRVEFDLAVTSQDAFVLQSNSWTQSTAFAGRANFYEVAVTSEGQMGLSLQNCGGGSMIFSYTQDYESYLSEKFDSSSRSESGATLDQLLTLHTGTLFFTLHSDSDQDISYILQTQSSGPFPHGRLMAGGDGEIEYDFNSDDPDKIKISFKPLKCHQCDLNIQENSNIFYEIVWATDQKELNTLGKCGAQQQGLGNRQNVSSFGTVMTGIQNLSTSDTITTEIDVNFQSDSFTLWLTVNAKVITFSGSPVQHYSILYQNTRLSLPKNVIYMFKHRRQDFTLGIGILILFTMIMSMSLCLIFKKMKQLKNVKLELELEKRMSQAVKGKQEGGNYGEFVDDVHVADDEVDKDLKNL